MSSKARAAAQKRPKASGVTAPISASAGLFSLTAGCAAVLIAGFFFIKPGTFAFEALPGFQALVGLVSFAALAALSALLRPIISRTTLSQAEAEDDA
ncbi:MAG: hypothetical protein AAFQ44_04185 [Pseudomonadota bacterium]